MDRNSRYQSPSQSEIYIPMPIDRARVGEKKIEQIQEQIERLENDQKQRKELIEKLTRMQETEDQKVKQQQSVTEKYTRRRDFLLNDEIERLYGQQSPRAAGKSPAQLMNSLLAHRNNEFALRQQEKELETQYLVKERERLQAARDKIREQRRALLSPAESAMSEPDEHYRTRPDVTGTPTRAAPEPRLQSAVSVNGYIKKTIKDMPKTMDKIAQLRQEVQKHYDVYMRPYRGEMGIQTYQPRQLKAYSMCRQIVEDVVNEFLDLHFEPAIPMVEKEAYFAIVDQRKREKEQSKETLSERRALQLEMEDIMQEVTGEMAEEVARENRHAYGTVRNMTDTALMNRAEAVVANKDEGREVTDPGYNVVTKHYYTTQTERNGARSDLFAHSLDMVLRTEVPPERRTKIPPPVRTDTKGKPKPSKPPSKEEQRKRTPAKTPTKIIRKETPEPVITPAISTKEDPDVVVLEYHPIIPVDMRIYQSLPTDLPDVKIAKMHYQTYLEKEVSYWHHMVPYIWELQLPSRCKGISHVSVSPNAKYVAFGTYQGDMFVYDTGYDPWKPIGFITNNNNDAINSIAWSLDSTKVITLNESGALNIWSLFNENYKLNTARSIGMPRDRTGVYPRDMKLLLDMDASMTDFTFKDGPLAEEGALNEVSFPSIASMYPSFSLLGNQESFAVGLENGDILKCDIEFATSAPSDQNQTEYQEAHRILNPLLTHQGPKSTNLNEIGRGAEAELLRHHKAKILYLGFIDNINDLVSIDSDGYIFKWRYDRKHLANIGWYKPFKKFRLATTKDMYEPIDGKAKLIFSDKNDVPNKRTRTRQEIANEREQVTLKISTLNLGDPWHVVDNDKHNTVTQIFAPRQGVKDTGAVFHIIERYKKTDLVASYVTRVYRPIKIKYTKMSLLKSQDGNEVIFFLLFPSYPPKEPHITIVILDLKGEQLRDFRRDWYLSEAEYTELVDKEIAFADMTRVFGPTGSEYLFFVILGNVKALSLTTGKQVVRMEDSAEEIEGFNGCIIDRSEIELLDNAQVATLSSRGKIFTIFFAPRSNRVFIIEFEDENQPGRRRAMWKYYQSLEKERKRLMPAELRVDYRQYDFDDKQHPAVFARSLVLDCMDRAIQIHHKARYNAKQKEDFMMWDKETNYSPLEKLVQDNQILTGL